MKKEKIEIYTDGACSGNPGPGGWGALLRYQDHEKKLSGAELNTTNNRMELMAAIMGLKALKQPSLVTLVTDSVYVKNGITQWLPNWKRRGWKTADNKPVKNQNLWEQLEALANAHEVTWEWVKGHNGHVENELADELAREAITRLMKEVKT